MKLKRKSKAQQWFAESRAAKWEDFEWFETPEGKAWRKQWNDNREAREAETRRLLQGPMQPTSEWLKEVYPDTAAPAPLREPILTKEDVAAFEQIGTQAGPDVIYMNPRDYAVLKEVMACNDWLNAQEKRLGRRLGNIERRWMEAKFRKKKCRVEKVDPIPFPEEPWAA